MRVYKSNNVCLAHSLLLNTFFHFFERLLRLGEDGQLCEPCFPAETGPCWGRSAASPACPSCTASVIARLSRVPGCCGSAARRNLPSSPTALSFLSAGARPVSTSELRERSTGKARGVGRAGWVAGAGGTRAGAGSSGGLRLPGPVHRKACRA